MDSLLSLMPEIFLAITLAGLIAAEISYHGEKLRLISVTAILGLSTAFIQTLLNFSLMGRNFFGHSLSLDAVSFFFKLFFIFFALLVVFVTYFAKDVPENKRSEINGFVVAAALAQCFLVQAGDLLLIFVSLQALGFLSVFLIGLDEKKFWSIEAGGKFLIFSAVSLGLFLYGAGILFHATQSLNIYEMQNIFSTHPLTREMSLLVFSLIFLSLAFFLGAFPMFFWAPDVLQGAPMPSSLFVSLGVPVAGLAVALRILLVVFSAPTQVVGEWVVSWPFDWTAIVSFSGGATALLGALLAFRQKTFKRMISCLVVSQMGFLMIGLTVLDRSGIAALFYALIVVLFSLVGIYAVLSYLGDRIKGNKVEDLRGAMHHSLIETLCLIFFLASFLGVPPAPGFISKFILVDSVIQDQRFLLTFVLAITFVIWMASFGKMTFSLSQPNPSTKNFLSPSVSMQRIFLLSMVLPMVFLTVFAEPVLYWVKNSLLWVFW